MTTTQVTVETAPRELEGLKAVGRFNLRGLATQLGVFDSEERKTAFMQEANDQQAATILKLLQERDGVSKPAAGKGTGGGGTGRSPSTKNAGKGAAGKPVGEAATGSGGGGGGTATASSQQAQGSASGSVAGDGAARVLAAIKGLGEKYDGIKESIDELTGRVSQLETISGGTNRFVTLAIGLNLKLAEQVLGASPDQVLEVVLEDMSVVENALAKLAPAEGEGEAAEDEAEEGNDE